ncbi:hypothetical protein MNBD_GAMMA03-468 [hydrothermal vent metagenome]|uniref:Acylneuraminate cytidylyltransferase n=1 Tax=hydrothermal vent metagenome TaxID=652676 RepID=A0A3B0W0M1_9ZZZZ
MKAGVIVQARMGSERFSGKVLKEVKDKPLLWYLVQRLHQCKAISKVIVATSTAIENDVIEEFCKNNQVKCFRGNENDVLDRYYQCALIYKMDHIVRITGDCPLIDPELVDDVIKFYLEHLEFDLVKTGSTYPEGFDAEIFSFNNLELIWKEAKLKSQREHVTTFLWENKQRFKTKWLALDQDYSFLRLTVDEAVDFEVVKMVIESFQDNGVLFNFQDILNLYKNNQALFQKNTHIIRNEGYLKSLQKD